MQAESRSPTTPSTANHEKGKASATEEQTLTSGRATFRHEKDGLRILPLDLLLANKFAERDRHGKHFLSTGDNFPFWKEEPVISGVAELNAVRVFYGAFFVGPVYGCTAVDGAARLQFQSDKVNITT